MTKEVTFKRGDEVVLSVADNLVPEHTYVKVGQQFKGIILETRENDQRMQNQPPRKFCTLIIAQTLEGVCGNNNDYEVYEYEKWADAETWCEINDSTIGYTIEHVTK